jgi:quinol-cytochrome oxidoreductase complex cytochrome b subunit
LDSPSFDTFMRPSFFHHLHPPTIPAPQSRLRYTLGAGGLAVFLCLILILTGAFEMFYYEPSPEKAAVSIQTITFLVPFGSLVRGIHYWAAQLLMVVSVLHLLRVVLTGAYAKPRRFNYLLGLFLLIVCLFLNFSGYILRWDEGIRWALVTGTNLVRTIPLIGDGLYKILMGGLQPGPASLLRFYAWHIFGLTLVLAVVGGWHLFRVRRDGGIAVPPPELRAEQNRISRFELVRREVLASIITLTLLILLALIRPAPLAPAIQVGLTTADGHAPWFFLWVQQLLKWGDPFLLGVLAPLAVLAWFVLISYILPVAKPTELGRWFPSGNRAAQVSVLVITVLIFCLTLLGLR